MQATVVILPIRDCTSDVLRSLGEQGYRIIAASPEGIVFAPQLRLLTSSSDGGSQ